MRGQLCYVLVGVSSPARHCQKDGQADPLDGQGFSSVRWEEVCLDQCKQIAGSSCSVTARTAAAKSTRCKSCLRTDDPRCEEAVCSSEDWESHV